MCCAQFFHSYFTNTTVTFVFTTIRYLEVTFSQFGVWLFREFLFLRSKESRYKIIYKFYIFGFPVESATIEGSLSQRTPPGIWFSDETFYIIIASPQKKFMILGSSCNYSFLMCIQKCFLRKQLKIFNLYVVLLIQSLLYFSNRALVLVYFYF